MSFIEARDLARRLTAAKLKVTPQRMAIYAQLVGSADHPSPETLYRAVKDEMPRMSLATIYKTLDAFEAVGLVTQLSVRNDAKRYDANLAPHHHLVCTDCRRIIDFSDEALTDLRIETMDHGFRPKEVKVQIMGVCAECQNTARARNSTAEDRVSTAFNPTMEKKNGQLRRQQDPRQFKGSVCG